MTLRPGDTVRKIYRILAKLSQGGFGSLYLGYDTAEERLVAIKESKVVEKARQTLQEEVELLSALQHESLVKIYDYFTSDQGLFCFAMEYIPGDNLEVYFRRRQLPAIEIATGWMVQILEALSVLHMHTRPIIHHDVSLRNIQIHGVTGRAYLLDLGVARDGPYTTLPPYSAPYIPPEQCEQGPTTTASDVYAAGICLYMLLTGVQPPESLARGRGEQLALLRQHAPAVGPALEQLVMQAIELDPDRRYPHAPAMLAALRAAIEAQPDPGAQVLALQCETVRLHSLLNQRRRLTVKLIQRRRSDRQLLERRRARVRRGLQHLRFYRRLTLRRRAVIHRGIEYIRSLRQMRDATLMVQESWANDRARAVGLALMVLCSCVLLLLPGNFQAVSLIIPLVGSYPLVVLGAVAFHNVRARGWQWHSFNSWFRLGGYLFYGLFICLIVMALLKSQPALYTLSIAICVVVASLGVLIGLLAAGVAPRR